MKSSSEPRVTLQINAADPATEIFVVDGQFHKIADGVSRLETKVEPGLYKVRFRAGSAQVDQLVEVTPTPPVQYVYGDPVEFQSVIPMGETSTERSDHTEAARVMSTEEPRRIGSGSGLFLFARDLADSPEPEPWYWMSVHHLDGSRVADLSDGEFGPDGDCAGMHFEVDPGTYRLRVNTGRVGTYEMFVRTAEEWQTQVFTCLEDFPHRNGSVRRAALRDAAVLMARPEIGYAPYSEQVRMAELARQGLVTGRPVVKFRELNEMLWMKWRDPMVALYGAHILVRRGNVDHDLLETVIRNLERLVGRHPDVDALRLRPGAPNAPQQLEFPSPPMLRQSWDLISTASLRRNRLVPPGSATDLIADNLAEGGPWLLHRADSLSSTDRPTPISVAKSQRMIAGLVRPRLPRP